MIDSNVDLFLRALEVFRMNFGPWEFNRNLLALTHTAHHHDLEKDDQQRRRLIRPSTCIDLATSSRCTTATAAGSPP
jgi:hypothetical protein